MNLLLGSSSSSRSNQHNNHADSGGGGNCIQMEHMFDKVLTPSDVGKLSRLMIPKQHAEKYFPLESGSSDKGLLLNFEDRKGKPWRFRYSYWNSSQSYVMTKGWSRFVKEKKLDAGDIVSFYRDLLDHAKDRLFIDWGRRPHIPLPHRWASARLRSIPPSPYPNNILRIIIDSSEDEKESSKDEKEISNPREVHNSPPVTACRTLGSSESNPDPPNISTLYIGYEDTDTESETSDDDTIIFITDDADD